MISIHFLFKVLTLGVLVDLFSILVWTDGRLAVPIMIAVMFIGLAVLFGGLIYSLYGAYQVYEGREFKYKWAGDWAEQQMKKPPAPPSTT